MSRMKHKGHAFIRILWVAAGMLMGLGASAQDATICKATCTSDKNQCRSGGEGPGILAAAGLLALLLDQPNAFATPSTMDNKRDMRDVLDARQRAAHDMSNARRETYDKCNSAYLKCLGACLPEAPNTTTTTP